MSRRGFSLVEVLVAMAILAGGLLGTVGLITKAITRGAHGRQVTVAQQLGMDLLEQLRNEVRFDSGNTSASNPEPDAVWKAQVLPHEILPVGSAGAECADDVCCQLPDQDDGVAYQYGPYPFRREGNLFYACYSLQQVQANDPMGNARVGIPTGSAEAIVRILWRSSETGWRSWTVGDLLIRGT